jgi:uncharacterized protein with HEPN domain
VKGIREVLVHEYEDVQVGVVTDAIATELPGLSHAIETILAEPER